MRHNLIPTPIHLSLAALTCPDLLQPLPDELSALAEELQRESLGRLPGEGLLVVAPDRLLWDNQLLLSQESTHDEAEQLLGRGRVGLWIPHRDGWLRARFDQSLLVSIELRAEPA